MAPAVLTIADRLNAALARISPAMAARVTKGWGPAGAPYSISTVGERRRITVLDPESGETFSGTGTTLDEAMGKLETRLAQEYGAAAPTETPRA